MTYQFTIHVRLLENWDIRVSAAGDEPSDSDSHRCLASLRADSALAVGRASFRSRLYIDAEPVIVSGDTGGEIGKALLATVHASLAGNPILLRRYPNPEVREKLADLGTLLTLHPEFSAYDETAVRDAVGGRLASDANRIETFVDVAEDGIWIRKTAQWNHSDGSVALITQTRMRLLAESGAGAGDCRVALAVEPVRCGTDSAEIRASLTCAKYGLWERFVAFLSTLGEKLLFSVRTVLRCQRDAPEGCRSDEALDRAAHAFTFDFTLRGAAAAPPQQPPTSGASASFRGPSFDELPDCILEQIPDYLGPDDLLALAPINRRARGLLEYRAILKKIEVAGPAYRSLEDGEKYDACLAKSVDDVVEIIRRIKASLFTFKQKFDLLSGLLDIVSRWPERGLREAPLKTHAATRFQDLVRMLDRLASKDEISHRLRIAATFGNLWYNSDKRDIFDSELAKVQAYPEEARAAILSAWIAQINTLDRICVVQPERRLLEQIMKLSRPMQDRLLVSLVGKLATYGDSQYHTDQWLRCCAVLRESAGRGTIAPAPVESLLSAVSRLPWETADRLRLILDEMKYLLSCTDVPVGEDDAQALAKLQEMWPERYICLGQGSRQNPNAGGAAAPGSPAMPL